jgi:CMP/dCMP kinase
MPGKITIAIDGPAASGKSTTARILAQKLGYIYVDSGAMYRAATLACIQAGINIDDEPSVTRFVEKIKITIKAHPSGQQTYINDQDVTHLIRSPRVNEVISVISAYPGVRACLVRMQRQLAEEGGVVMDGRDIGTVVLPDADLKVFMVASIQERARRRLKELQAQGEEVTLEEVEAEISQRDRLDSSRNTAPLKMADDARPLDTSQLTIDGQVAIIEQWAKEIQD